MKKIRTHFPFLNLVLVLAWILVVTAVVHALWVVFSAPEWPATVGYVLAANLGIQFAGYCLFILAVVIACLEDFSPSGLCSANCIAEAARRLSVPVLPALLTVRQPEGRTFPDVAKNISRDVLLLLAMPSAYLSLLVALNPPAVLSMRDGMILATRPGFFIFYFVMSYMFLVSTAILLMKGLTKIGIRLRNL